MDCQKNQQISDFIVLSLSSELSSDVGQAEQPTREGKAGGCAPGSSRGRAARGWGPSHGCSGHFHALGGSSETRSVNIAQRRPSGLPGNLSHQVWIEQFGSWGGD